MKPRFFYWLTLSLLLPGLLLAMFASYSSVAFAEDGSATPLVTASGIPSQTVTPTPGQTAMETAVATASFTPTPTLVSRNNKKFVIAYTAYIWHVIRLPENIVNCVLVVDRESEPQEADIRQGCTTLVADLWLHRTECPGWESNGDVSSCRGEYLRRMEGIPRQKTIAGNFLPATAWIQLEGCVPIEGFPNRCYGLPRLKVTGEEPIPGERIVMVEGTMGGTPFKCAGSSCLVDLEETEPNGVRVDFWARSSVGDESKHYYALVRVYPVEKIPGIEGFNEGQWIVDVLSSQWRGAAPASCADVWDVFPDLAGSPEWLQTVKDAQELASDEPLAFLGGWLIRTGEINVEGCPSGGLLENAAANTCGLERARTAIIQWQNQFDGDIIRSSQLHNVPPRVIKKIFDRESQFWPGIYETQMEAGFGHLTDGGADTLLMWNENFFNGFCPAVFSRNACSLGYFRLGENERSMLRGALLTRVNAACTHCTTAVNLDKARYSIDVFAAGLKASCVQTAQIVYNVTQKPAGASIRYEDLWQLTLVNYNAGSGCLDTAVRGSFSASEALNWSNISPRLEEACKGAIVYVEEASWMSPAESTPTIAPQKEPLPARTSVIFATPTATITQTPAVYPYP